MRRSELRARGFCGFFTLSGMIDRGPGKITGDAGVYAVLRLEAGTPRFLSRNQGGHFKGKDPTVNIAILERRWVQGTQVLYVGKTDDLRRRIDEPRRFGAGQPIGHWGSRYIWQIGHSDKLVAAWLPVSDSAGGQGVDQGGLSRPGIVRLGWELTIQPAGGSPNMALTPISVTISCEYDLLVVSDY